jgi:hypothetical protein
MEPQTRSRPSVRDQLILEWWNSGCGISMAENPEGAMSAAIDG